MKETQAPTACACGCGIAVKNGTRLVRGHWSRTTEARAMYTKRRQLQQPVNQTGLCECGCGRRTPIATDNHPERGYYKGQHVRYIRGHQIKRGAENPKWRGGRWVHPTGYVWIYAPDHPHTNAKGYVYEHRLVVEKRIGRFLNPGERVHHLNHQRGDNRDENLILFPSHSAHVRAEHKDALKNWSAAHPEASKEISRRAGKKGAETRWRRKK